MEEKTLQRYDFGKNCVIIGRVSTSQQSQTAQIADLKEFAKGLGYEKIQPFFTTESGFLEYDDKKGWNLVTDFFESHPDYKVLICPEMSRLSRRESILIKIKEYLRDHKIQLIIKDIGFSLYNEWGVIPDGNDVIFALFASLADSEMRQKKERTRRVLEDNRRQGFSIGGKELFGYTRQYTKKDGKERSYYKINEEEAKQIIDVYKWYAFGIDGDLAKTSIVSIAKKCIEEGYHHYLHSKRNVNKCLKEKAYTGQKETHNRVHNAEFWNYKQQDKPKYIKGKSYICSYPPIFEGENAGLFEKVQERLRENNSKFVDGIPVDKSTKHITILSKLIKCPNCGAYLCGEYRNKSIEGKTLRDYRSYFTYRCHQSRGAISNCGFKHTLSMSMMDSAVWAYCKDAVLYLIESEQTQNIEAQMEDIERKISNINQSIKEYNFEDRVKREEIVFRGKTTVLKSPEAFQKAAEEYQQHLKEIDNGLKELEKNKLELIQEIESIKKKKQLLGSIARHKDIATSKKELYKYIHRLVEKIDFIYSDSSYTVLQVHLKQPNWFCREDEFLCIKKNRTPIINALTVHPVDLELVKPVFEKESVMEWRQKIRKLPSKNNLRWDEERQLFEIDGLLFSLEELFSYNINPLQYHEKYVDSNSHHTDLDITPVLITKLEVERLQCYEEDKVQQ